MTMIRSDPKRESDPHALPDVEVFEATSANSLSRSDFDYNAECGYVVCQDCRKPLYPMEVEDGISVCCGAVALEMGWYWQACFPGCLPDGEPTGPFDTEAEAIADVQSNGSDTDDYTPDLPQCAIVMGCLCAGHARGNPASAACDTNEHGEEPDSITYSLAEIRNGTGWSKDVRFRTVTEAPGGPTLAACYAAVERAIRDVCDEDTQNEISDRYRELIGETDD